MCDYRPAIPQPSRNERLAALPPHPAQPGRGAACRVGCWSAPTPGCCPCALPAGPQAKGGGLVGRSGSARSPWRWRGLGTGQASKRGGSDEARVLNIRGERKLRSRAPRLPSASDFLPTRWEDLYLPPDGRCGEVRRVNKSWGQGGRSRGVLEAVSPALVGASSSHQILKSPPRRDPDSFIFLSIDY